MDVDIEAKIDADFSREQRDMARAMVRQLDDDLGNGASRILRCVLFLAGGDLGRLGLWSDESRRDWRDVIVAAKLGDARRGYRDLRKPFMAPISPDADA